MRPGSRSFSTSPRVKRRTIHQHHTPKGQKCERLLLILSSVRRWPLRWPRGCDPTPPAVGLLATRLLNGVSVTALCPGVSSHVLGAGMPCLRKKELLFVSFLIYTPGLHHARTSEPMTKCSCSIVKTRHCLSLLWEPSPNTRCQMRSFLRPMLQARTDTVLVSIISEISVGIAPAQEIVARHGVADPGKMWADRPFNPPNRAIVPY